MKLAFLWGGLGLCAALAGCTVPPRDVVDIAEPAQVPSPPVAAPAPPLIDAPTIGTGRLDPPVVTPPVEMTAVIRHRRLPRYPTVLAEDGIGGQVIAVFYVDAEGKADEVRIESSPHPLLSQAVTDALKEWRFDPARSADGRPVRTRMRLPFRFQTTE
jgi:protein TonB